MPAYSVVWVPIFIIHPGSATGFHVLVVKPISCFPLSVGSVLTVEYLIYYCM